MNDDLERSFLNLIEVYSRHLPGGSEKPEKNLSKDPISKPRIRPDISEIKV
jgi:hypothetical protein